MLFSKFVCFLLSSAIAQEVPFFKNVDHDEAEHLFEQFIVKFNRHYENLEERRMRFGIFKKHLHLAQERNLASGEAVHGITKFFDFTDDEKAYLMSTRASNTSPDDDSSCTFTTSANNIEADHPEELDWRTLKKVSPVKEQSSCGSCWAFGAVGLVESQYAMKHNEILDLSEQQLVDCDPKDGGCSGGLSYLALETLMNVGGIESEDDYPYKAKDQKCKFNKTKVIVQIASCSVWIDLGDIDEIKGFLYKFGPLAISVNASVWDTYHHGILKVCSEHHNHSVLLVGYGAENGVEYWIVKNSWGRDWGEDGYIRVAVKGNACGFYHNPIVTTEVV